MPGSAPVAGDTIVNKAKSLLLHHVHSGGNFCVCECVVCVVNYRCRGCRVQAELFVEHFL